MTSTRRTYEDLAPLTVRILVAARMLGIGKTKLYELIAQREIEILKLGSATLIVVDSLHAFIERQRAFGVPAGRAEAPGRLNPSKHGNGRLSSKHLITQSPLHQFAGGFARQRNREVKLARCPGAAKAVPGKRAQI